jgi:uncharacterized iron-regulated membrane protein
MSLVDKTTSKRLLAVHGWSGVLLGLFLYVVIVTGAVAVLAHEIGQWSVSGARSEAAFSQPLDTRIKQLADTVDARFKDDLFIEANAEGALLVFFHTHGTNKAGDPDDLGVRFTLEPGTLNVLRRDEGFGTELPGDRQSALDHFIAVLHTSLHAPNPVGLYLTGIAGFVMLFAVISGIILHRHLLRDLFVAPRLSSRLLNRRDRHILAGSWGLPFGFLVAFTGTFFSFAGAIGLPIVAMVSFGGDQVKMVETLVGVPVATSHAPAAMADIDAILRHSISSAGSQPDYLTVAHWGKADAKMQVTHGPAGQSIEPANRIYNMQTGAYEGAKPDMGTRPSLGSKVFSWMGPLHFGHFAGLLSKMIWTSMGLAMCYVTLSGLRLWVERRSSEPGWQWLAHAIPMVGYGVPLGLAGAAAGFLLAYPVGDTVFWTGRGFLFGVALAVGTTLATHRRHGTQTILPVLLAGAMIGLPALRLVAGGTGWPSLIAAGQLVPIMLDIVLIVAGGVLLALSLRSAADVGRGRGMPSDRLQSEAVAAE